MSVFYMIVSFVGLYLGHLLYILSFFGIFPGRPKMPPVWPGPKHAEGPKEPWSGRLDPRPDNLEVLAVGGPGPDPVTPPGDSQAGRSKLIESPWAPTPPVPGQVKGRWGPDITQLHDSGTP